MLHTPSGRWRLGLALALATALFWATLPVALKLALEAVDAWTLTWFRFLLATLVLGLWLGWRGRLGQLRRLSAPSWWWLALAALGLIGNYIGYILGLDYTSPANAQLLIQLAPLLMAAGGVIIFKERLNRWQLLGFVAVSLGLLVFFLDQRGRAEQPSLYNLGGLLIAAAAATWAGYALIQKQLLRRLDGQTILWVIYVAASLLLLPTATPSRLLEIDAWHWLALLYCAFNTLGAYGAFAEALAHWEASRVSAVLALTPLLTVATVMLVAGFWPGLVAPERIGMLGWCGAFAVVAGSAAVSLLGSRR